jgi:16S rRNA (cytosine1402-N4)-methyltransferase
MTHIPVLLEPMIQEMNPFDGAVYLDGTFGRGGYTRALLEEGSCIVCAMDRDGETENTAQEFKKIYGERFHFRSGCFGHMKDIWADYMFDGIVLDIGVSSPQIDEAARGFSFRHDGPLDMRMGQTGPTAADLVNNLKEEELAHIFYRWGEEKRSRHVAKAIVNARQSVPITSTTQLAHIIHQVVRPSRDGLDPATRSFQGLRIAVNDELGELERALAGSLHRLKPGGKLIVVTFHSLEDRIVKRFFEKFSGQEKGPSRHNPMMLMNQPLTPPLLKISTLKPVVCSAQEMSQNPRARSAKLRCAIRTEESMK